MKAQYIVTIEGDWLENDRPATIATVERDLRKMVKEGFDGLASTATVRRTPAVPHASDCRNAIINSGAGSWPKSCQRCGLVKNCPDGVVANFG